MKVLLESFKNIFMSLLVLATTVIFTSLYSVAFAANTNSIELSSSSSQYLSILDGDQTGLDITGDMTIEAWVNFSSTSNERHIISKYRYDNNQRAYDVYFYNNQLILILSSNGTDATSKIWSWTPSTSTWYHLAIAYDASAGLAELFVNGISQGTGTGLPTYINNSSAEFDVGAYNGNNSSDRGYFDGLIDDVRVWNIFRSGTEVSDDMSRELNGNESGLVAYWKLNNGLTDLTGNSNTLTNNGSAAFSASTPFAGFSESLRVRKSSNESVANSTTPQNDDELKLSLAANKEYIVDGVVFASSTSATPDIAISFFGQTGVDVAIGYTNDVNEMVLMSGKTSNRINLPANTPTSIHIKGTVKTGSTSGDFQLKWAQVTSSGSATTVMKGSYLRAEEI